ncbi:hypothetical protein RI367_008703 [Sorochytrium milnesiophthora]
MHAFIVFHVLLALMLHVAAQEIAPGDTVLLSSKAFPRTPKVLVLAGWEAVNKVSPDYSTLSMSFLSHADTRQSVTHLLRVTTEHALLVANVTIYQKRIYGAVTLSSSHPRRPSARPSDIVLDHEGGAARITFTISRGLQETDRRLITASIHTDRRTKNFDTSVHLYGDKNVRSIMTTHTMAGTQITNRTLQVEVSARAHLLRGFSGEKQAMRSTMVSVTPYLGASVADITCFRRNSDDLNLMFSSPQTGNL